MAGESGRHLARSLCLRARPLQPFSSSDFLPRCPRPLAFASPGLILSSSSLFPDLAHLRFAAPASAPGPTPRINPAGPPKKATRSATLAPARGVPLCARFFKVSRGQQATYAAPEAAAVTAKLPLMVVIHEVCRRATSTAVKMGMRRTVVRATWSKK